VRGWKREEDREDKGWARGRRGLLKAHAKNSFTQRGLLKAHAENTARERARARVREEGNGVMVLIGVEVRTVKTHKGARTRALTNSRTSRERKFERWY
jgi:hypothetical protein